MLQTRDTSHDVRREDSTSVIARTRASRLYAQYAVRQAPGGRARVYDTDLGVPEHTQLESGASA